MTRYAIDSDGVDGWCHLNRADMWQMSAHRPNKLSRALVARIAGRFARVEPRRRARAFLLGLLADLPRKNCWTIAEHAGDAGPEGMQHFLVELGRRRRPRRLA
jgi:hypothetical protein